MHEPPKADVCSASRLFRVLSSRQPRWPVAYSPPGLEGFRLEARGLAACEAVEIFDGLDSMERDHRASVEHCEIVALTLLADGKRAFTCADDVAGLPSHVVSALALATYRALSVCSPLYRSTNDAAWDRVLVAGARENWRIAMVLGGCVDDGMSRTADRPDRYFGCPLIDVTDGQWMAFRAARSFLHSITPKPAPMPRKRK